MQRIVIVALLPNHKHQPKNKCNENIQDSKCSDNTKKPVVIRMGREVPSKTTSGCDTGADTKCSDKKEKARENMASSNV